MGPRRVQGRVPVVPPSAPPTSPRGRGFARGAAGLVKTPKNSRSSSISPFPNEVPRSFRTPGDNPTHPGAGGLSCALPTSPFKASSLPSPASPGRTEGLSPAAHFFGYLPLPQLIAFSNAPEVLL